MRNVFQRFFVARGVSAVEFAFILPLFLLILFGIFEFGRAYYQWQIVQHAIIEGIEFGVQGLDMAKIETRARARILTRLDGLVDIDPANIQVVVPGDITNPVRVSARTDFNSLWNVFFDTMGVTTVGQLVNSTTSWFNATRTDRTTPIDTPRYNPPSTPTDINHTTPVEPSTPSSPGNPTSDGGVTNPTGASNPTTSNPSTTNPIFGGTNPSSYTASGSSVNYVDLQTSPTSTSPSG